LQEALLLRTLLQVLLFCSRNISLFSNAQHNAYVMPAVCARSAKNLLAVSTRGV